MAKRGKRKRPTGAAAKPAKRRARVADRSPSARSVQRRANAVPASPGLDPELQSLRERLTELEDYAKELRAANEELGQERAELRDRAGVIEQRYSELLERSMAAPATESQVVRDALDEARRQRDAATRTESFWMVCPKCGGALEEVEHRGVKIDRCRACAGLYLDRGELELLTSMGEATGFFVSIRSLFS